MTGQFVPPMYGFARRGVSLAVAHDASPYVSAYPWNELGFGTKHADNSGVPGNASAVAYSLDGGFIAIAGTTPTKPKAVPLVDEQGAKIVHDATGQRVKNKDGKKWRETASTADGYVLQTRPETAQEYREELEKQLMRMESPSHVISSNVPLNQRGAMTPGVEPLDVGVAVTMTVS